MYVDTCNYLVDAFRGKVESLQRCFPNSFASSCGPEMFSGPIVIVARPLLLGHLWGP